MPLHRLGFLTHSGGERTRPQAASRGFRTSFRPSCDAPASRRRTRLAENLGKPSLWVFIIAPWYKAAAGRILP